MAEKTERPGWITGDFFGEHYGKKKERSTLKSEGKGRFAEVPEAPFDF